MTAASFDEVVNYMKARKPYRIFTIELNDGERYEIDHPRVIVLRESGVAVFLSPGGMPIWFDHDSVIRVYDSQSNLVA